MIDEADLERGIRNAIDEAIGSDESVAPRVTEAVLDLLTKEMTLEAAWQVKDFKVRVRARTPINIDRITASVVHTWVTTETYANQDQGNLQIGVEAL
jgi:hypothetical protein